MSTKKTENKKSEKQDASPGVAAGSSHCRFQNCKSSSSKFGFCQEHYQLYMEGVIRGDGTKPIDFEKKLELYLANKRVA